jgi:predicted nucleotide-binding protein
MRAVAGAVRVAQVSDRQRNARRVMVVHGRNHRIRDAMFTYLRALGLAPIEWNTAVAQTTIGSPHNFAAVRAAMESAQAVVVVLTAEDQGGLIPELAQAGEDVTPMGQPRQNVVLEAGLAMGINPDRTILVEVGPIRRASDFDGLNVVRLDNGHESRNSLRSRLETAGCPLDDSGNDWLTTTGGGDFASWARPAPASAARRVTAVGMPPGDVEIFALDGRGVVMHTWWKPGDPQWSAWAELGGHDVLDIAAASWGMGHMQVFALGSDHVVWTRIWRDDAEWWRPWVRLVGEVYAPIAAASSGESHVEVFAHTQDGDLVARAGDGTNFEEGWRVLHWDEARRASIALAVRA